MNEAIVESYRNCKVNTIAIYVGAGTGSQQIGEVALNNTIIRVVAPGEAMPSGFDPGKFVAFPQGIGDIIYELKSGDRIYLSGKTYFSKPYKYRNDEGWVFVADSLKKVP
jgi:hypothetical protein